MPKDLFTLKKTIGLYEELLSGAKINKIIEPSPDEVVFTLYKKTTFNVVISTKAKYPRVSLTTQNYKSPLTAPNFCMLLRKYLLNGTLESVVVSDVDRIISITISNENDFKEFKTYTLNVEIMGKYSNVFLTSNQILLGALKNSIQNYEKGRILLAGAKYLFPPKQDKISPYDKHLAVECFSKASYPTTGNFILNNFLGFAPVTAEEIAFLINEKAEKQGYSPILAYNTLEEFLNKELSPVIISSKEFCDLFVFDYRHLDGERKFHSDYLALEESFYTGEETSTNLSSYKNSLQSKILAFKKKEEKKLELLLDRENQAKNNEKYRLFGELILANIYKIKKGDDILEAVNYYSENNETIKISLDKNLSPQENSEKYYKKYTKLKKSLAITLEQLKETYKELEYASNLEYNLSSCENIALAEEIELELKNQGFIKNFENKKNKNKKVSFTKNCLIFNCDGFTIKAGKNNLQNEALLDEAKRNDLWLHVKDYHSSFVIIEVKDNEIPNSVLQVASEICAYHSQSRNGTKIAVDITKRKFVKKPPKSRPGSVIYTDYKTVFVDPNPHSDKLV